LNPSPGGMWSLLLSNLVLLGSLCLVHAQFQTQFQDYDTIEAPRGRAAPSASRAAPSSSRAASSSSRAEQRETTTPVPILKQINEHNEDGSYTYGYEAADGTFKLETRFADGAVQGKYGYVDVNGEVKIIEYGANAMGFQPQGDLPEGIIIPPPVEGNCTDCNYDYDYDERPLSNLREEDRDNINIVNRARGNGGQQTALRSKPVQPNQNRGQDLDQPITPPPLPRRPEQTFRPAAQQQFSAFPAAQQQQPQPAFLPTPPAPAFRPTPAAPRPQTRPRPAQPLRAQSSRPGPATRARPSASQPVQSSSSASSSNFANFPARGNPNRARSRPESAAPPRAPAPARAPTPARAPAAVPARPAPARAPAFPARPSAQDTGRQQPNIFSRPATAPAPVAQQPIRPAFEDNSAPRFSSFQPVQGGALPARPPPARPALTFADAQPAVPANLPKSALEIVDFNQLVQEFQGSQGPQQPAFGQPPRFSTDNFPVRY